MKRQDIRLKSDDEKAVVYSKIDRLYKEGAKVEIREHRSGFPAVTVDCEDIHILTDILSLERWVAVHKKGGRWLAR